MDCPHPSWLGKAREESIFERKIHELLLDIFRYLALKTSYYGVKKTKQSNDDKYMMQPETTGEE